jgi:hypothetical protein
MQASSSWALGGDMVRTIHNGDPNSFSSGLVLRPCLTLGRAVDRLSVDLEIHPPLFSAKRRPPKRPPNPADRSAPPRPKRPPSVCCIGVVPGT